MTGMSSHVANKGAVSTLPAAAETVKPAQVLVAAFPQFRAAEQVARPRQNVANHRLAAPGLAPHGRWSWLSHERQRARWYATRLLAWHSPELPERIA